MALARPGSRGAGSRTGAPSTTVCGGLIRQDDARLDKRATQQRGMRPHEDVVVDEHRLLTGDRRPAQYRVLADHRRLADFDPRPPASSTAPYPTRALGPRRTSPTSVAVGVT